MRLKRISRILLSLMCVFTFVAALTANQTTFAADGYLYTSEKFGYSIKCPQKPLAVMNLSIFSPEEKGDILVFENDGYNLTKYWIVSPDAFSNDTFPDLDNITQEEKTALFTHLAVERGYETVTLVPIHGHNAIYGVTAKNVLIDSDKDGKVDKTIEQPGQSIETYFKGKKTNYCVTLTSKTTLTQDDINAYQYGLLSFMEN